MDNYITTDMFLSLASCITIVTIATQILKKYVNYDAKWLALLISAIVVALRIIIIGDYSLIGVSMGIMNIVPILLGAVGSYESVIKPIGNVIDKQEGDE